MSAVSVCGAHRLKESEKVPEVSWTTLVQPDLVHLPSRGSLPTEDIWIQSDGAAAADLSAVPKILHFVCTCESVHWQVKAAHLIISRRNLWTPCIRDHPLLYRTWYVLVMLAIIRPSYAPSTYISRHCPAAAGQAPCPPRSYALLTTMARELFPRRASSLRCCLRVWRICSPLLGRSMASPKASMTRTEALL